MDDGGLRAYDNYRLTLDPRDFSSEQVGVAIVQPVSTP